MIDCVTLTDSGEYYTITVPGKMLRTAGLLVEEVEDATLQNTHLAVDDPTVLVQLDESEGALTIQLPDPPENVPDPNVEKPTLTDVEQKVLEQADAGAD
ncbi:hypothetical protein [Halobellus litoreus]|uniref:Uncharacterized protein n=1 Tax=Halobellus litoreus TaxID=755310 RepID=A0ABD6E6M0_9EURY|nr:hypothetical protein [Halobellus litoreus]